MKEQPDFSIFKFYNEKNELIDHLNIENTEQELVKKYISKNDVVLELGARYGTVSCTINKILNNPKNQISVEPDYRVWDALEMNKNINNCHFQIIKGFVSNKKLSLERMNYKCQDNASLIGYGSTFINDKKSKINNYSLLEIKNKYDLMFNTLVADCEGYLESFFDENSSLYHELSKIIFEEDYKEKCDYEKIRNQLRYHKFRELEYMPEGKISYNVWMK